MSTARPLPVTAVFRQYMTRVDGLETPAKRAGYPESVTMADGQTVYTQRYRLTRVDEECSIAHLQPYASGFEASKPDVIGYHEGICYICIGSVW